MESDLEDIKQLDLILAKSEPVEDQSCMVIDEDWCDDDLQDKDNPFDFKDNIEISTKSYSLGSIKPFLTDEEYGVIESCPNLELQKVMILNRVKFMKLKDNMIQLKNILQKCIYSQEEHQDKLEKKMKVKKKFIRAPAVRLGYPYFKDSKGFPSPANPELINKRSNGEISPYYLYLSHKWTFDDQCLLSSAVKKQYNEISEDTVIDEIDKLNKEIEESKVEEAAKIGTLLEEKENELKSLQKGQCADPPLDFKFNWDIIASEVGDRHSAISCEAFWKMYYHPAINKSPFTSAENAQLRQLAEKHKYQNWDLIAKELGTNRSAYTLCAEYYSKIHNKYSTQRFTEEEDVRIQKMVDKYRIGNYIPWTKISMQFKDRKKEQIYHRYKYHICNEHTVKGVFTDAEDILIYCLLDKFGRNLKQFLPYLPHRSQTQIRHRIVNYLDKINMNLGNWSVAEDQKILDYVKEHGEKNWAALCNVIPRNRYHLRQRYQALSNWIQKNPDRPISELRRRNHSTWQVRSKKTKLMKRIAQQFKKSIPTLQEIESFMEKRSYSNLKMNDFFDLADEQLVEYFKSIYAGTKLEPKSNKVPSNTNTVKEIEVMKHICTILNVRLKIPDSSEILSNPHLDDLDKQFLVSFKSTHDHQSSIPSTSQDKVVKYFPPSVMTTVALRSLLIKHKLYKDNLQNSKSTLKKLDWNFSGVIENDSNTSIKLFGERLRQIFRWPCIMSMQEPSNNMKNVEIVKPPPANPPNTNLKPRALKRLRMIKVQKMVEAKKLKKLKQLSENKTEESTSNEMNEEIVDNPPEKVEEEV